jgi:bifunctional DNase/RNase
LSIALREVKGSEEKVPGDFDKLFDDDWRPQEADPDGLSSLRGSEEAQEPGEYTSETENTRPRSLHEKEVKVMGVYAHQEQGTIANHFVLLRDNRGRRVPIFVGQFEAWAISLALEGDSPDRPFTHDLIRQLLERLDATIERIIIDDLWNETFYAKIGIVKADGETLELDARPSDAIALALRVRAPIYMAETVLEATIRTE